MCLWNKVYWCSQSPTVNVRISLQCRRILGERNLVRTRNCCSRHLWFYDSGRLGRVEIVTLTVGAKVKEGKGGGEGRKNTAFSLPSPRPLPLPLTCLISPSLCEVSTWHFREQIACSKETPALQAMSELIKQIGWLLEHFFKVTCRYLVGWVVCNLANLSINVKNQHSDPPPPPHLSLTIPVGWFYNLWPLRQGNGILFF